VELDTSIPGLRMVDGVEVAEGAFDQLLAALLMTGIGVFSAANALLMSSPVLARSLPVAAVSMGLLTLFVALARFRRSPAWALAACYGLLLLTVYGSQELTVPALDAALAFGMAWTVFRLRLSRSDFVSALGMAAIGTATILGTSGAYTSFDMIERLHAGNVHLDTLYHASMAAMIKNYGVTSTGLNGLVATPYHALSHALFGAVSLVSRAPVIEVYGVASWVLFAPLLIFAASASCLMLDSRVRLDASKVWCSVCLILALAPLFLGRWAVWDSYFVSESYLVALSLFLLAIPLLLTAALGAASLLLLVAIAGLLCAAKASVGLIFIGLFGIRLVLLNGRWKTREALAFLAMMAAAAMVMSTSAVANRDSVAFAPWDFVEQYSFLGPQLSAAHRALRGAGQARWWTWWLAAAALAGFIGVHFSVTWGVLIATARRVGVRRALRTPIVVMSLGAVLAGLCVVSLFGIAGGSAYYFTNVAFFVSLPAAAAALAGFLSSPRYANRPVLAVATALVLAVSVRAYWNASQFSSARAQPRHNELIGRLLEARKSVPRRVILEADSTLLAGNPVTLCRARPFVFPAVSERPWIGVMAQHTDCRYEDYGYENYRPAAGSNRALPARWPLGDGSVPDYQALP